MSRAPRLRRSVGRRRCQGVRWWVKVRSVKYRVGCALYGRVLHCPRWPSGLALSLVGWGVAAAFTHPALVCGGGVLGGKYGTTCRVWLTVDWLGEAAKESLALCTDIIVGVRG